MVSFMEKILILHGTGLILLQVDTNLNLNMQHIQTPFCFLLIFKEAPLPLSETRVVTASVSSQYGSKNWVI